jgi:hypothetical protein
MLFLQIKDHEYKTKDTTRIHECEHEKFNWPAFSSFGHLLVLRAVFFLSAVQEFGQELK